MAEKYRNNTDKTILVPVSPGGRAIVKSKEDEERRKKFLDSFEREFGRGKFFMKYFVQMQKYLNQTLTPSEYGFLMMISYYACAIDNILRAGGKRHQRLLNKTDLSKLCDIPYKKTCTLLDSLMELRIIDKIKTVDVTGREKTGFVLNPYIAVRGTTISKEIADRFKETEWYDLWCDTSNDDCLQE